MLKTNMPYVKSSFALCCFLFIFPPNRNINIFRIYVVFLSLLWLCIGIYSFHEKTTTFTTGKYLILKTIEISKYLFQVIANVGVTIKFVFVFPRRVNHIYSSLADFDKKTPGSLKNVKKYFWFGFFFSNITCLAFIALKRIYWFFNPFDPLYYEDDFLQYRFDVGIFFYFWLALELARRHGVLNESLRKLFEDLFRDSLVNVTPVEINTIQRTKKIANLQHYLVDIVQDVNDSFGFFILLYLLFAGSFVIEDLILAIWYTDSHVTSFEWMDVAVLRWVYFYGILEVTVRILAIAAVGSYMTKESNNTIAICYNIIHSLEHDTTINAQLLKEELRHLANQVMHRRPYLSAAGFFDIDFTMMGSIAYSITSYIIVAIQFLRE